MTGLKAVNAFWNPFYYDPSIPTITKQLVYTSEREVEAMHMLFYNFSLFPYYFTHIVIIAVAEC